MKGRFFHLFQKRPKLFGGVLIGGLLFWLGLAFLLAPNQSPLAKELSMNPYRSIDRLAISRPDARYIIIPDFSKLIKNARSNEKIDQLLKSQMGRDVIAAPPVIGFQQAVKLAGILPEGFKLSMLSLLFNGGAYYASTPKGFVLVFQTNRLSKAMLKKFQSKKVFADFEKSWFVVASSQSLLAKQKELLSGKVGQPSPLAKRVFDTRADAIIAINNAVSKEAEKDLFFALLKSLLPSKYVNSHVFSIQIQNKSLQILGHSSLVANQRDNIAQGISQALAGLSLQNSLHYNTGGLAEFALDLSFLQQWFEGRIGKNRPLKNKQPSIIYFAGLEKDYGLVLPQVAFSFSSRGEELTSFLADAFAFRKYERVNNPNGYNYKYLRYRYYRNKRYYSFSPVYKKVDNRLHWATSPTAMLRLEKILKKEKVAPSRQQLKLLATTKLLGKPKKNETAIGYFYANLARLHQNSAQGVHSLTPVYFSQAYGDFKDKYNKFAETLENTMAVGMLFYHRDYLRFNATIQL